MSRDPLDLLGDLPYWPGTTPPKSSGKSPRKKTEDELHGARSTVYRVNGEDIEMFTIGELARAIGRKPVTIRKWELQGWIPRANFRTPTPQGSQIPDRPTKGRRLYSRSQVEFLAKAVTMFNLEDKSSKDWDRFRAYVRSNWPK